MVANRTVKGDGETPGGGAASQCSGYVLPLVHARVPEPVVGLAFVGALAATVIAGAVELPAAALIGAGVVVARHRTGRRDAKAASGQTAGG